MFVKRLNEVDMQAAGLQLTAEELYNINNSSLKMPLLVLVAFVQEKLFLQRLAFNQSPLWIWLFKRSSVENDYLTDGFWAWTDLKG